MEGASFDGLIPAGLEEDVKIVRNDEGTVTYLEYILKLNGYFDAYYLTGLSYKDAVVKSRCCAGTGGASEGRELLPIP